MRRKAGGGAVTGFDALHKRLSQFREQGGWIFRGHSDVAWRLVPKAGRDPYRGHEERLFEAWKRKALEYLPIRPESDWEWLAIAQHHGLATRLLDWTTNPLNAAYFAVRDARDTDAVIFAARFGPLYFAEPADIRFSNGPMTSQDITVYRPRGVVPRITRQGGLFTVHGPPDSSFEDLPPGTAALDRIVIDAGYRARLLAELAFYGVTSASLFPDLDGLSMFLNWATASGHLLE